MSNPVTKLVRLLVVAAAIASAAMLTEPAAGDVTPQTLAGFAACVDSETLKATVTVTNDLGEGDLRGLSGVVSGSRNEALLFDQAALAPSANATAAIKEIANVDTVPGNAADLTFAIDFTTNAHKYSVALRLITSGGCQVPWQTHSTLTCTNVLSNDRWLVETSSVNHTPNEIAGEGFLDVFEGSSAVITEPLQYEPRPVPSGAATEALATFDAGSVQRVVRTSLDFLPLEMIGIASVVVPAGDCVGPLVQSDVEQQPPVTSAPRPVSQSDTSPRFTG
jgi:hypothetical protein